MGQSYCGTIDNRKNKKKQCDIHSVVFNKADKESHTITLELNKPVTSKLSDWKENSEVELCEHKCTMLHENSVTGKYAYCLDCNTELKHN